MGQEGKDQLDLAILDIPIVDVGGIAELQSMLGRPGSKATSKVMTDHAGLLKTLTKSIFVMIGGIF